MIPNIPIIDKPDKPEVRLVNSVFFQHNDKIIECALPECQLDKLEVFDLNRKHPAWSPTDIQKGLQAKENLEDATVIGFYAGIYRPAIFSVDNPYVFGVHPDKLDMVIDASRVGNITRYINDPRGTGKEFNLKAEDIIVQHESFSLRCVQFRTTRLIEKGEELFINYEASSNSYWSHPQKEVIDFTKINDVIVTKREKNLDVESPLKKLKAYAISPIIIVNTPRIKDLEEYSIPFKLIQLTSAWKIELVLPVEFSDINFKNIKLDLQYFDALNQTFVSCNPKNMFAFHKSVSDRVHVTIKAGKEDRIAPFPYTSIAKGWKNLRPMRFVAKTRNIRTVSMYMIVVGNYNLDFNTLEWRDDRKDAIKSISNYIHDYNNHN